MRNAPDQRPTRLPFPLGPQIHAPYLRAIFAPGEPGPSDPTPRPASGIDAAYQNEIMSVIAPVLERAERESLP
ncbi:hypothetical protein ACW7BJ_27255 [Azospirillum argentinense]